MRTNMAAFDSTVNTTTLDFALDQKYPGTDTSTTAFMTGTAPTRSR